MALRRIIRCQDSGAQRRGRIPFRSVNRKHSPGYEPGLQRHHLLPCQLLSKTCFARLIDAIGREQLGFDDFRRNGLLLPANDTATLRMGLPLHRGPHRLYNEMVIERVGEVERFWSDQRLQAPEIALEIALMRLSLLQRALRRRLLEPGSKALRLNRRDPVGFGYDFTELDAMADQIWAATDDPFTQG